MPERFTLVALFAAAFTWGPGIMQASQTPASTPEVHVLAAPVPRTAAPKPAPAIPRPPIAESPSAGDQTTDQAATGPAPRHHRAIRTDVIQSLRTPILMYHHLGTPQGQYPELWVPIEKFDEQMRALSEAGITSLTMAGFVKAIHSDRSFSQGSVVITFDDGTDDQMLALPILQKYGLHATLYVPSSRVGNHGYLTWDQLKIMKESGLISIEGHTRRHHDLTKMNETQARAEIIGGARILEDHLGIRVRQFAYPFGKSNDTIEQIVRDAGFASAVSNRYEGLHQIDGRFHWGRVSVRRDTGSSGLVAMARAARFGG